MTPRALPLHHAHLIGLISTLLLYGTYVGLYFTTLWTCGWSKGPRVDVVRLSISLLFALSTAQAVLSIIENWKIWITYRVDPGPLVYLDRPIDGILAFEICLLFFGGIIADSLLVWRLYIVWSRSVKVILLPVLTLATYAGCALGIAYYSLKTAYVVHDFRYDREFVALVYASAGLLLFTSLFITLAITGKLWWASRQVLQRSSEGRQNWCMRLIQITLESGALLTATLVTAIAVGATVPGAVVLFSYIASMVIGIAPTLLVLRVNLIRPAARAPQSALPTNTAFQFSPVTGTIPSTGGSSQSQNEEIELEGYAKVDDDKFPV